MGLKCPFDKIHANDENEATDGSLSKAYANASGMADIYFLKLIAKSIDTICQKFRITSRYG